MALKDMLRKLDLIDERPPNPPAPVPVKPVNVMGHFRVLLFKAIVGLFFMGAISPFIFLLVLIIGALLR
jgi:hypothetical protein